MNAFKIKPLEWHDDEPDFYGNINRSTAIADTWNETTCPDEEWKQHINNPCNHRIYARYDVFVNMDEHRNDIIKCRANWREEAPVVVESLEEGKKLCEQWNQEYWTTLMQDIMTSVIEN